MLHIHNFRKRYHETLVLEFPDLSLDNGLHWFKGENGSGKSTLFKSIAGLLPFEGSITYQNIDIKTHPIAFRKIVNYSEAEPFYPGFVTAKDLIRFVGKAKGATREQEILYTNLFGINSYYEKTCEAFSSGMLKKLSLCMAFLGEAKVIILDEPLVTLDEAARNILLNHVKSFLTEKLFLISSHQLLDDTDLVINKTYKIENRSLHVV